MTLAETLLASCVVGLACFIGGQTAGAATKSAADRAADGAADRAADSAHDVHAEARRVPSSNRNEGRRDEVEDVRRRLTRGASGTYLAELLAAHDSAIARWPDRITRPLRIFVGDAIALDGWNPEYAAAVRDAFETWTQAGIPVHFTFVRDSATADILVHFVEHLANGISGKTVWSRDGHHWLLSGHIQLAMAHPSGGTVTAPQMRAIALHEVGHLLGLDHTANADNIMSARVRVRDLSDVDKATVRLVYAVPAGSVKR